MIYEPDVKALAVALYSEGVMANDRIGSFLNAVSKCELGLSEGNVYGFCKICTNNQGRIDHLEEELINQARLATDATTICCFCTIFLSCLMTTSQNET